MNSPYRTHTLAMKAARLLARLGTQTLFASALMAGLLGCSGGMPEEGDAAPAFSAHHDAEHVDNGLSENGLTINGYITNGYITNGYITNGYITNGYITNGYITNGYITNGYVINGYITNGYITNGYITNGATPGSFTNQFVGNGFMSNGLIRNGLAPSGLSTDEFIAWFNSNPPDYSNMVMRYLTKCALPAGQTLSWTNPVSGDSYTWNGVLGLASGWTSGQAMSPVEQQVMTACMAAHVNKFGLHVQLSLSGADAQGTPISTSSEELATFDMPEGCFFGNLFDASGAVYVGSDRAPFAPPESSVRACAISVDETGTTQQCAAMQHIGTCSDFCVRDPSNTYYTSCTYNGVSYIPLNTRISSSDVYTCGDGICQVSEHCGSSPTTQLANDCGVDCGTCQ